MKKILIIEDDPDIRDSLKELLEMEGYSVACATNGQEGLERLEEMNSSLPHIILLDLMMPIKDGIGFRQDQRKRESWNAIPTVVMSADGNAKAKLQNLGITTFLKKPVDLDAVLLTITQSIVSD
ncbi:MAG: response regulator transcription factor [Methylotenera sp.]|nr:response regulator transcription factor [Oligoflexia bacterium]